MAVRTFLVPLPFQTIRGYALGQYHPYGARDAAGQKVRNPRFDNFSQQVLNVKESGKPQFLAAGVRFCTQELSRFLTARAEITRAEFVIVPSSTRGQVSPGLTAIVNSICRADRRFTHRPNSLKRTRTIEKLARGGDRSLHVHLASMEYVDAANAPEMKIVLDDVFTTGNSIAGAIHAIQAVIAPAGIYFPVVLGQTTRE